MATFTAAQKQQMSPGKGFELAQSFGFQMPASDLVDISDDKKTAAYDAAEVKSFTKTQGPVTVNIHILYNGKNEAVAAFSPENPNVAKAPIATIIKAIQ